MNSKDLMSLISEEISELSLLCGGMTEMESVPSAVLSLAKSKATILLQRIELLESYQNAQSLRPDANLMEQEVEPEIQSEPIQESLTTEVAEEEPVAVVEKVEYQPVENPSAQREEKSAELTVSGTETEEKHEPIIRQENKPVAYEYGTVRTVLDANRSSKRVESRFVQSIRKAITLNDRIRYMNVLFGGDAALMNTTIEQLDQMSSLQEAQDYVNEHFSWGDDEAVTDFMRLLEDRFS